MELQSGIAKADNPTWVWQRGSQSVLRRLPNLTAACPLRAPAAAPPPQRAHRGTDRARARR
eukprot:3250018-Prymnesium_polylepis.1